MPTLGLDHRFLLMDYEMPTLGLDYRFALMDYKMRTLGLDRRFSHCISEGVAAVGATSFDEISSLHNLTSLFISLDRSAILCKDYTWMKRLKSFRINIGDTRTDVPFFISQNKSRRIIRAIHCEFFSNGKLSGMLKFASDLYLDHCNGIRKLIAHNSFDGLKSLDIYKCSCEFTQNHSEEGSGQVDPLPNLEHLSLKYLVNLKSVSDFCQLLGLRFSKLRLLNISCCGSLTSLFNVEGPFSVPKHLEEIEIRSCSELVELFEQGSSSQTTVVNSEIRKLNLRGLRIEKLEPESIWKHLEELKVIGCNNLRKLPLSIQTSNNIKLIEGRAAWWSQLEWDDDNHKTNLEHCFTEWDW